MSRVVRRSPSKRDSGSFSTSATAGSRMPSCLRCHSQTSRPVRAAAARAAGSARRLPALLHPLKASRGQVGFRAVMGRVTIVQEPLALAELQELVRLVLGEAVQLPELGNRHAAQWISSRAVVDPFHERFVQGGEVGRHRVLPCSVRRACSCSGLFDEGQSDGGEFRLKVDVPGGHVDGGAGVPGLQQQGGGHEAVVGHVEVEPVRQPVALGFDVFEDGVHIAGHPYAAQNIAVGSQPFQAAVGLLRRIADVGVAAA